MTPPTRRALPADLIDPKWTDELRIYGEGFVGRQDELAATTARRRGSTSVRR